MAEWTGEMTLGDGSVVKGATMEEAFQNLAKMKVDTANALKTEREEKTRLAGQVQTYEQTISQMNQPKKEVRNGEFDKDEYYRLLNADPVAANDYYFQYRFGRNPEEFNAEYQRFGQTVSVLEQQTMAAAFSAQHADDFPHSPEAAKSLRERVESLANQGLPLNLTTLNYAYSQLVDEGVIKPVEPTTDEGGKPNPTAQTSGRGEEEFKNAESLSDKELLALMRKNGMQV